MAGAGAGADVPSGVAALFSATWDGSEEGKQQGRKEAIRAFHDEALKMNKKFKQDNGSSSSRKVVLVCAGCDKSCPEKVAKATLRRQDNKWRWIASETLLDHVNCVTIVKANFRDVAALPAVKTSVATAGVKCASLKQLQQLAADAGLQVNKTAAYRAKRAVLDEDCASYERSFQLVAPFLEELKKMNEDSATVCANDEDGRFAYAGFCLASAARTMMACGEPVTQLDATFFNDGAYKGRIMVLEAILPGKVQLPLGIIVHHGETKDAFKVLIDLVLTVDGVRAFLNSKEHCMITDRGTALIPAVAECLPAVAHQYCAMHLLLNVLEQSGSLFEPYFWKVVKAKTPQALDDAMAILKGNNPKAAEYLDKTDPTKWQLHHAAEAGVRKFKRTSSTCVEGENNRFGSLGLRAGSPLNALAGCLKVQAEVFTRLKHESAAIDNDEVLGPSAKKLFEQELEGARKCRAVATGEGEYIWHVTDAEEPHITRTIDLAEPWKRHGSCLVAHQEMRPCKHVLAAAVLCKDVHGVFVPGISEQKQFLAQVHHATYLASNFKRAMNSNCARLVDTELLRADGVTKPTVEYTKAERNKGKATKRHRSRGEDSLRRGEAVAAPAAPAAPAGAASAASAADNPPLLSPLQSAAVQS